MMVEDLSLDNVKLYCMCLEDWSDEMAEAGDHKEKWYCRMKDLGLRVKLARDERGEVGGMIQYIPIESSFAEGKDLYLINCIWVHGHKKGRGDFRKRGMGKALLAAAEEDARALGAKGLVAWGLMVPVFMRAAWFKKHGYIKADRMGMQVLLWKPFTGDAQPPRWIRPRKRPVREDGKVSVCAFKNGWCPAQNIAFERTKRAVREFEGKAVFTAYDTFDRETFLEWGISDALFIDGREIRTGPPPSYEKIRGIIARRARKLP